MTLDPLTDLARGAQPDSRFAALRRRVEAIERRLGAAVLAGLGSSLASLSGQLSSALAQISLLQTGQANRTLLSVRAATTANLGVLSGLLTVDTVALVAGDRVLVKNQAAPAQNGIWTAAATAWVRAADMDSAGEVDGKILVVEDGGQAGTLWITVSEVAVLNTDPIVWAQFNAAADITAGAGLTKTGLTLDLVALDGSLTVTADAVTVGLVGVAKGGTGASTVAGARSALGAPGEFWASVTGGAVRTIAHNLNLAGGAQTVCHVVVVNQVSGATVATTVSYTNANSLTVDLTAQLPTGFTVFVSG